MHRSLTEASKSQEADQAFLLTVAEYNALTTPSALHQNGRHAGETNATRRNLADSLAALRKETIGDAAEVYTRSLLWEQIPAEVVKQFKELVRESKQSWGDVASEQAQSSVVPHTNGALGKGSRSRR